jgi:hypothetical protein
MEGNDEMILPLVDVSGSMDVAIGGNENLRAMDVAISLGLYISERNIGPFKDSFITFSRRPQMHVLTIQGFVYYFLKKTSNACPKWWIV